MGWGTPEWVRSGCEAALAGLIIVEATNPSDGLAARFLALLAERDMDGASARLRSEVTLAVGDTRPIDFFMELPPVRQAAVWSTLQRQVFRPAE